jgi:TRAP-type C4-dicarboxylate transport system permease small subunit
MGSGEDEQMTSLHRLAQAGLWFGGTLVLLAAFVIAVDVVLRRLFNGSIGGADELAGYALAIGTAWGLAAALLDRAHIRIDSLYLLFPRGLRHLLDALGVVLLAAFFSLVAWHGTGVVAQSWMSGSRSQSDLQTPTVVPQLLWLAGLVLFVIVALVLLGRALMLVAQGDHAAVARAIGTRSAAEAAEAEVPALTERAQNRGR